MGTIKKIFFGVLILLISILIYFTSFRNIENPRINFFYNSKSFPESKFNYYYFLGKLSPSYYKEFEEKTIVNNDKCKLVNILRKKHPNYHNYLVYKNKESSKEYLLKNSDSQYHYMQGAKNQMSSQICLTIFNMYLKSMEISKKEDIIDNYFYISSTIGGDTSYKTSVNDTLAIYQPINNLDDYKLVRGRVNSIATVDTDSLNIRFDEKNLNFMERNTYCWFKNRGVYKFNFEIKNDTITNVTDAFQGYIGNEKW